MPKVVHFEIHADDPQRAAEFYRNVFDWEFNKWDGPQEYWLINTGEKDEVGIHGGMMRRKDPAGSVYNTIQVASVDDCIEKIMNSGGTIVLPKHPIPGVGYLAYFKDTEGNIFGIMHPDQNVK